MENDWNESLGVFVYTQPLYRRIDIYLQLPEMCEKQDQPTLLLLGVSGHQMWFRTLWEHAFPHHWNSLSIKENFTQSHSNWSSDIMAFCSERGYLSNSFNSVSESEGQRQGTYDV